MIKLKTNYSKLATAFQEHTNGIDGSKTMKDIRLLMKVARKIRDELIAIEEASSLKQKIFREKNEKEKDQDKLRKAQEALQKELNNAAVEPFEIELTKEELQVFMDTLLGLKVENLKNNDAASMTRVDEFLEDCEVALK